MRAALPITISELIGMLIAATSGFTLAIIARGTMIALYTKDSPIFCLMVSKVRRDNSVA